MIEENFISTGICIHRSADTIGGNCIEILSKQGQRLLLDAGRPLDTPSNDKTPIPSSLDLITPIQGILLSHSHTDHVGLLSQLPDHWPVYCGEATAVLMKLGQAIQNESIGHTIHHWKNKSFNLGHFKITPYLTDHSAFDSYMLLIEVDGKSILYSGDFRNHGRKGELINYTVNKIKNKIDVLLLEGTNLQSTQDKQKPTMTERTVEDALIHTFNQTKGRVFITFSSTNIDRLISIYRACIRTKRKLVLDLFSTLVLVKLKEYGHIPQPNWQQAIILTVITNKMKYLLTKLGENVNDFIVNLKSLGVAISPYALNNSKHRLVIMVRDGLVDDYLTKNVEPNENDCWIWSMWNGYLELESTSKVRNYFSSNKPYYIHTSGHASPLVLKQFTEKIKPKILLPIHGEAWQSNQHFFDNIHLLANSEWLYF